MSSIDTRTAEQRRSRIMGGRDLARPLIREILREIDLTPEGFAELLDHLRSPGHGTHTDPPGEVLADERKEIGISAAQLARSLEVAANRISQIFIE